MYYIGIRIICHAYLTALGFLTVLIFGEEKSS
jgi:hypothetical protein